MVEYCLPIHPRYYGHDFFPCLTTELQRTLAKLSTQFHFFKWSTLCNWHSNRNNGKVGLKFWCCRDQRLQLSPGSFLLCFLTVSLPPVIPGQCMSLYATVIPLLPYVRKGVCVWVPVDLRLNIKPLRVIRERETVKAEAQNWRTCGQTWTNVAKKKKKSKIKTQTRSN